MAAHPDDGSFRTSDGAMIAFSLHRAPAQGAPRLALVHSLALDRRIWDGVVGTLEREAEILTYDCRGHGRSDRRAGSFTTDRFARDLRELFDTVGWLDANVAGCSMGGCVAQGFAGLFPSRVLGLGLVDTTAWYGPDAPAKWRERALAARATGLAGLVDFQATRWFSDEFRASRPDLVTQATETFLANDLDCYDRTCRLLGDADLRPFLALLHMPVTIVVGEDDFATPVAMSRHLHDALPQSSLTIIPRSRHLTPVESPGEVASALHALLFPRG